METRSALLNLSNKLNRFQSPLGDLVNGNSVVQRDLPQLPDEFQSPLGDLVNGNHLRRDNQDT